MEQHKRPCIALSLMSDLPTSLIPGGILRTARLAADLGLGLHLVPMLGMTRDDLVAIPPDMVLTYEGPWDQVKKDHNVSGYARLCMFGPKPLEKVQLFKELFPDAICVDPRMCDKDDPNHPGGVCVDPLEISLTTMDTTAFLRRLVVQDAVKAVRFRVRSRRELQEFIDGEWNKLSEYLAVLQSVLGNVPIIIGLPPHHLWMRKRKILTIVKNKIERFIFILK